jgi:hypothetical protein
MREINPTVSVTTHTVKMDTPSSIALSTAFLLDVLSGELVESLGSDTNSKDKLSPIDVIISHMSTSEGRMLMGDVALRLGTPMLDISILPNYLDFSLTLVIPGQTACLRCYPSESPIEPIGDKPIVDALLPSLPSMQIFIAGIVTTSLLKLFLEEGDVESNISYLYETNYLSTCFRLPLEDCPSALCSMRSLDVQGILIGGGKSERTPEEQEI